MMTLAHARMALLAVGGSLVLALVRTDAGQAPAAAQVQIDPDDIGGVVEGRNGPEAGVWVIAETNDLGTRFRKIVVTDDGGRFVLPDLPTATYRLWVRGYGLVDSSAVAAGSGQRVALTAVPARNPQEAAQVYPANYWLSLIRVPSASEFPGTGPAGNGISPAMRNQQVWIDRMKDGCEAPYCLPA